MIHIASINQDRGIAPGRSKGAAVHLRAMRDAFTQLGCVVEAFDAADPAELSNALEESRNRPFDLVYERYALGKDAGARFAEKRNIPLVLEVNAPLADETALFRGALETPADRQSDAFLFGQADCVLAVSSQVAEYARERGARPETIMVCPNGIDSSRFHPRVDATQIRRKVAPAGEMVIGFHGRERPWHGFDHLVAVVERLLDQDLAVHLLVVGNGEFSALSRLPPASCTKVGWRRHEDMPSYVSAFDVLPLTYQPDMPFYFSPLKLMEAMACGVVPVVPDMGDLASLVRDNVNGLVYPAGDMAALESGLVRMTIEVAERRSLGAQAAIEARAHAWTDIARSVLDRVFQGTPLAGRGRGV